MNNCGPFSRILDPTRPAVIHRNLDPIGPDPRTSLTESSFFQPWNTRAFYTTTVSVHCLPLRFIHGDQKTTEMICLSVCGLTSRAVSFTTHYPMTDCARRSDPPLSAWNYSDDLLPCYSSAESGRSTHADYPTDSSVVSLWS